MSETCFGKGKYEPEDTLLNFCLIFRCTLEDFERVKNCLLTTGARLVYQTKSADKIVVTKEAESH
jgi:hypothetical protein